MASEPTRLLTFQHECNHFSCRSTVVAINEMYNRLKRNKMKSNKIKRIKQKQKSKFNLTKENEMIENETPSF